MIIRNHIIEDFLHCRRKWKLKQEGWEALDGNPNLSIGKAVHAGLEVWSITRDEAKAYLAAFKELGGDEELEEVVYACLNGYFTKWKNEDLQNVSTEIEFSVPLYLGVEYGLRIDGLVSKDAKFWVKETKTSGWPPGKFWKLYRMDRQTIGYKWASAIKFGVPVEGALIDVIFKPNNKVPEPKYERQYLPISDLMVEDWKAETIQMANDMQAAILAGNYYKSRACWAKYNSECEFFSLCSETINQPELFDRLLLSTHKLKEEENG